MDTCSVCGRAPHPCDDPECVPANAPLAEKVRFLVAENEKLRKALRHMILVYRVADEAWDKEAETDRLMSLTLGSNERNSGAAEGGPADKLGKIIGQLEAWQAK